MVNINKFYWDLYKNSPQGKNSIGEFTSIITEQNISNVVEFVIKYDPDYQYNASKAEIISMFSGVDDILISYSNYNSPKILDNLQN